MLYEVVLFIGGEEAFFCRDDVDVVKKYLRKELIGKKLDRNISTPGRLPSASSQSQYWEWIRFAAEVETVRMVGCQLKCGRYLANLRLRNIPIPASGG